ncbi:MAG: MBL fold metallo-hydrolase [Flavobacteriales bacterium]|nr:MBL fold metallo-hydrolase [Flavobacteriales bacterium]
MKIEQIYTGCLAEAAYYIQSQGEAIIIDPLRETSPYIERAEKDNAKIKYVFLTHFHADFVSGHVDLANKTGALIVFGPNAKADFDFHVAQDGEEFKIGELTLKLLHTPGHTMESSSLLLLDKEGKENCVFTGDTLFIGDVGRPDLAVKSDITQEDLAAHLFDSLRSKLMTLPDSVIVYPSHGAGSACGKNMSKETFDTLGHQKEVNYALRADMTKAEFVKEVLTGLTSPPAYFPKNVAMNKSVNTGIDHILKTGTIALDADTFKSMASNEGAMIIDTRHQTSFTEEHIPGSIFFGIDGGFAPWVGTLVSDINQPIIIVADEGREEEVVTRLSRIGYDNSLGFLKGGITAWKEAGLETSSIISLQPSEIVELVNAEKSNLVDIRKPSEFLSEHVEEAVNAPLDVINDQMDDLSKDITYHVHCAGGYRSVIYISIMKSRGYHNLIDVAGGYGLIKKTEGFHLSEYVCPTTL